MAESEVESILQRFIEGEKRGNLMTNARVIKMTDKASFPDLPDYHFIADYETEADGERAIERMKKRYKDKPHASLMKMVSEFRVAFSREMDIKANPGAVDDECSS